MLIDRDYELNFLEEQYKNKTGSFIIVYGRRRIGKTFLINEFTKNKPNIYLLGTREIRIELIKKFSMKISEFFNDEIISKNPLTSWDSIFEYIIEDWGRGNTTSVDYGQKMRLKAISHSICHLRGWKLVKKS